MSTKAKIILLLVLGLVMVLFTGCGRAKFKVVEGKTCSVVDNKIMCPDGSSAPLPENGTDGQDRRDGTTVKVIDPCGDGPGPDEVLIKLDVNVIIAWYQNLGFAVLNEGVTYRTTDEQRCRFRIIDGNVLEL